VHQIATAPPPLLANSHSVDSVLSQAPWIFSKQKQHQGVINTRDSLLLKKRDSGMSQAPWCICSSVLSAPVKSSFENRLYYLLFELAFTTFTSLTSWRGTGQGV